ncbi:MAG TPA: diaminopimelate decarboxylase, partial [Lachnospiraceae bacterium]|nr:diaminopimelate decarboxylase [Lachnospiraceae bacterium]
MKKVPFVTKEQVEEMIKLYPTPFHLYDEKGIRETARNLYKAFSWNEGFKEYFAVKATPTPAILKILHEEGCGVDCSSMAELVMAKRCGFSEGEIMFSSNDTPLEEFTYANEIGGIINLDDVTHVKGLQEACKTVPETVCCRYNPGGVFELGNTIMDNPGDAK